MPGEYGGAHRAPCRSRHRRHPGSRARAESTLGCCASCGRMSGRAKSRWSGSWWTLPAGRRVVGAMHCGLEEFFRVLRTGTRIKDPWVRTARALQECLAFDATAAWREFSLACCARDAANPLVEEVLAPSLASGSNSPSEERYATAPAGSGPIPARSPPALE